MAHKGTLVLTVRILSDEEHADATRAAVLAALAGIPDVEVDDEWESVSFIEATEEERT